MRKMITIGTLLFGIGLLWTGGAATHGVQPAAAASPSPADDQSSYGGTIGYPAGPYGGTMPYSGMPYGNMPYGGMMPYSGYPYGGSGAYPMQGTTVSVGITRPGITITAPSAAAQGSGGVRIANFSFNPAADTVAVGQTVTWMNADSVAHTTTSDTGAWNSGPLQPGASFSQTFNTPGTFSYHCMIHPNMMGSITVTSAAGAGAYSSGTTASSVTPQTVGPSITYGAGWNLVAGPAGTTIAGNNGPLYTFRAGDSSYETVSARSPLTAGSGYWAYFNVAATQILPMGGSQPGAMQLPAGRFILIGNPGTTPMTVTGADTVLTYDAARGYVATTTLQPGQGAWAFSMNGGTLTMAPAGSAEALAAGS